MVEGGEVTPPLAETFFSSAFFSYFFLLTLFERVTRGMRLTSAGDTVVTLARRWRTDERRAASDLKQLQGIHQGVHLAFGQLVVVVRNSLAGDGQLMDRRLDRLGRLRLRQQIRDLVRFPEQLGRSGQCHALKHGSQPVAL